MQPIRRILVCGAGAVGSSYVERLHDLDPGAVAVVARGERRARLERRGLTVNGRTFRVRCAGPEDAAEPADLVLVAVKHHHLDDAIADMRGLVGARTILISLLNGIVSERLLGEAFGAEKVLHAFVIGNDNLRQGEETRYSRIGKLYFGAASNDPEDARVLAVKDLFDRAGIPYVVPPDILREQWWKFMFNVGVNQVSAVMRAPYGAFLAVPELQQLARRASLEAVALAQREGIRLAPEDVDTCYPIVATLAPGGKTSMLQDIEAGRKTEVEIFSGTVVELGRRHGVPTPVNEVLLAEITALERMAGVRR